MRLTNNTKLIIVALVSILCSILIYSKLKNMDRSEKDLNTFVGPVSTTTKNVMTTIKKHTFDHITISEDFIREFPKNAAFWNRKLHLLLRHIDLPVNQTLKDPRERFHCQPESFEVLQTNIQDLHSYPSLYQDFLKGIDCRDPPIVFDEPGKCMSDKGDDKIFLIMAIKSTARHFERRQAVRETWGQEKSYKDCYQVRTVFLLGRSTVDDPNLDKLIALEAQIFQDILVWDFHDSFYNLTLKEHVFFKWMLENCPQASFIFKGDDDVFVNTQAILNYLQSLEPSQASTLYTGQIISNTYPVRDVRIKYYVPNSFYDGNYPEYAGGGGFLFSGSLLPSLYHMSFYIPFFPIDDVYTGMCFKALGITPVKHNGFKTFDIPEQDRENPCAHQDLMLVHQRNPQQIVRLWRNMHSSMLTC